MPANTLRWTEEQLDEHQQRVANQAPARLVLPVATGKTRKPDMNKTEAEYAAILTIRQRNGEILWWQYEAVTLKLADNTRYTPDFLVMRADGSLEIHETKGGFVREDGWVKLKIAAALFPFRFFLCQKQAKKAGGGWQIRMV